MLDSFQDAFASCNLHNLGFQGYEFTWWNRCHMDQYVEEHLDRYNANIEWSLLFPSSKVYHINVKISDIYLLNLNMKVWMMY